MKKIARITTQKKNKHRYNIFLHDGKEETFGFGVDEDVFVEYNLHKGMELTEAMVEKLKQEDTLQKSYAQVIRYLGYRMRTKKEIYDYLVKKEVDDEHIIQIIDQLIDRHLIDDREFANAFVRTRIQTTAKGPGLVKQELREKGVSASIADEAVKHYDYGIQYDKASKFVEKRSGKSQRYSIKKQHQQLQATLIRNGFTRDVIQDVLANVQEDRADDEWQAICFQGGKVLNRHSGKLSGYELKNRVKETLYRQGFTMESILKFIDQEANNI